MRSSLTTAWFLVLALGWGNLSFAQLAPEIGYVQPPGAQAGTTVEVKIGGYDWTPDMQIFVHDPRVRLELLGPPGPVLVPEPPYWFGAKGRGYAWPLPREFPARLTVAGDVPPGLVKFQVANANGVSPPGFLHVGATPQVNESRNGAAPQVLSALPVIVNGQIRLIEEIDRYEFTPAASGPLTIELFARRFGSLLHGLLQVHDARGQLVFDRADAEGRDFAASFIARAGERYTLSLHDLDYAGDRSYVYRLAIGPGPHVQAAYPAGGTRGATQEVEFFGRGIATGADQVESHRAAVTFPASPDASFLYRLITSQGSAPPIEFRLSSGPELVQPAGVAETTLPAPPCAITGSFSQRSVPNRFKLTLQKDQKWRITAQARELGSPLDLHLALLGGDGKEVVQNDDLPGTTDAGMEWTVPADGEYILVLSDTSGQSGRREAHYRLVVEPLVEDFALNIPTQLAIPLGTTAKLPIQVVRRGGFSGPVTVSLSDLPAGLSTATPLTIEAGKNDLPIDLAAAPDAAAKASLVKVTATAQLMNGQTVSRTAPVLLANIMKPRIKLTPEGLDDVRKVHRGSTFLAPVLIERLEGFTGEIRLEMTSKQQRHRQGLASDEFVVPAAAQRVEYPIFIPEWLETTKTSRMILNGAVQVPDPQGNVRTLLQKQELRIGILPQGAFMKLSAAADWEGRAGTELRIPFTLLRAAEFQNPAEVRLVAEDLPEGLVTAEPVMMSPDQTSGTLVVRLAGGAQVVGEHAIRLRAESLQDGKWPVVSEASGRLIVTAGAE